MTSQVPTQNGLATLVKPGNGQMLTLDSGEHKMHKAREHHSNNILLAPGTVCILVQNDTVASNCLVIHVARTQKSEPETEIPRGTSKSYCSACSTRGKIAYYPLKSP
jgi:hypothetical protein